MRKASCNRSAAAAALLCLLPSLATASMPAPYGEDMIVHEVSVPRLDDTLELQTDLTKPPWTLAARLTGNLDWRRIRTADLPITTYLFYDSMALHIGYRCETTAGKDLRQSVRERDQDLKKDDHLNLELDVGPTGRVFYRFLVNPLGTIYDSVIIDKTWNSTAEVKTVADEAGWTAVMRIPFSDFGLGEPSAGSFWKFNLSTRSGFDNSWAPVLGGYHIPEEFAKLVFAEGDVAAVRMLAFKPLRIGVNRLRVDSAGETLWQLATVDQASGVLTQQAGVVPPDGEIAFTLDDDRIDHVNFEFRDARGNRRLSFWRPAEIPEVLSRLPALREKAAFVEQNIARYPREYADQVRALLAEVAKLDSTALALEPEPWAALDATVGALERKLTDAWLYAHTLAQSSSVPFSVALATPMDKVLIEDHVNPARPAVGYELCVARNEHEAVQVVVVAMMRDVKGLSVTASPPVSKDGKPLDGAISTALVGHVKTTPAGSYLPDYVGWYPDPILDFQNSCDAAVGEHISFWVDVSTAKSAAPGEYHTTLTVTAEECPPISIPLTVNVWDIELPQANHLRNAFTYTEPNTKRIYGQRWSADLAKRYHDFILDHRLNIDSLYGKQDRDPELMRYGMERGMNAFNLFYVGRGAGADVVRKLLDERMPALVKAGVDKMAYLYGFDEVNDEVFPRIKEVFGLVGELYPNLPRMTTGYDNTFGRSTGLRDYIDLWVPLIPEYDPIEAERLRAEGNDMWWYLCVGPRHPYPNYFVEYPAIESRLLMGAMSYKYGVGGVLYFMTNGWSLNDKPVSKGPYTDWFPGSGKSRDGTYANGDGSIFCPGPDGPLSTIRMENIRDGMEDYEYLYRLAELTAEIAGQPASPARLDYLKRARDLLAIPDDVVRSSSRYTYDSAALYELRSRIAETILEGRVMLAKE